MGVSKSHRDEIVLKPYGLLDEATLRDLTSQLENDFMGRTPSNPSGRLGANEKHVRSHSQGSAGASSATSNLMPSAFTKHHRPAPAPPVTAGHTGPSNRLDVSTSPGDPDGEDSRRFAEIRQKLKLVGWSPKHRQGTTTTTMMTTPPRYNGKGFNTSPSSFSASSGSPSPRRRLGSVGSKKRHPTVLLDGDCAFCGTPLSTTLSTESGESVALICGRHQAHEQCVQLNQELDKKFPSSLSCPKCFTLGQQVSPSPILSLPSLSFRNHARKPSRGSQKVAQYATFSSASEKSPSSPQFQIEQWSSGYTPLGIRRKFADELYQMSIRKIIDSEVTLGSQLLSSFGQLRLFDKLSISIGDTEHWTLNYCYLFDYILVLVSCDEMKCKLLGINSLVEVDSTARWWVKLQGFKDMEQPLYLSSGSPDVLEKWGSALANRKVEFPVNMVTSTIRENEFEPQLGPANKELLPKGVNPAFYESTMVVSLPAKPERMLIVLNQQRLPQSQPKVSLMAIVNILKSLVMVHIEVTLLLCSDDELTMHSKVIEEDKLDERTCLGEDQILMGRIQQFQENDLQSPQQTNYATIADGVSAIPHDALVIISSSDLGKFDSPEGAILMEVNSNAGKRSSRDDVTTLINWEDCMEVICSSCGLEFDDSDFGLSSDDSDDDSDEDDEDDHDEHEDDEYDTGSEHDETESTVRTRSSAHSSSRSSVRNSVRDSGRWSRLFNDLNKALEEAGVDA